MTRAVAGRVDDLSDDPGGNLEDVVVGTARHKGVASGVHGDANRKTEGMRCAPSPVASMI